MGAGLVLPAGSWNGTVYNPVVATDIIAAETAIVAQLTQAISVVEVLAFPSDWETFEPKHQNGSLLVRYDGSTYGELEASDVVTQWRKMNWEMLILVRELGWLFGGEGDQGVGAYGLIEQVRQALTGFAITGFKPAFPTKDQFIGYREGYWAYAAMYAFATLAMQNWTDPVVPLLTKATFNESGGVTSIAVPTAPLTFNGLGNIVLGQQNVSAVVVSNTSSGAVYVLGTDYTLDAVNGIITRLTSGGISAGATVNVSYVYADVVTALASGANQPTAPTN
jgi:Gp37 protein